MEYRIHGWTTIIVINSRGGKWLHDWPLSLVVPATTTTTAAALDIKLNLISIIQVVGKYAENKGNDAVGNKEHLAEK